MSPSVADFWGRAKNSLKTARHVLLVNPDTAASQAYNAAFYAVSAFFEIDEKAFVKHTAVQAAVHRDLVHAGVWSAELGRCYDELLNLRIIGDYGADRHVTADAAERAIELAERLVDAVARLSPEHFPHD